MNKLNVIQWDPEQEIQKATKSRLDYKVWYVSTTSRDAAIVHKMVMDLNVLYGPKSNIIWWVKFYMRLNAVGDPIEITIEVKKEHISRYPEVLIQIGGSLRDLFIQYNLEYE